MSEINPDTDLLIEILEEARLRSDVPNTQPRQFKERRELALIIDLIDEKYIRGDVLADKGGPPRGAAMWGITHQGRQYLQKLKSERGAKSAESERKVQGTHHQTFNIQNVTGIVGNVTGSHVSVYDYGSIQQAIKNAGVPREARNEIEDILDELKKGEPERRKSLVARGEAWVVKHQEVLGAAASIVMKAIGATTDS
jgi:hypothetical protein